MTATQPNVVVPPPLPAEPVPGSVGRSVARWIGMFLASVPVGVAVWCAIFWAYHNYAIEHGLEQTQKWYYDQDALPLYARWQDDWRGNWETWRYSLPPIAIFAVWVPLVVARLKGVRIPVVAWAVVLFTFVLCMNVAVAEIDGGWGAITKPFAGVRTGMEYFGDVPRVEDKPWDFVRNYPTLIRERQVCHHAGTHPPGGVVFLWLVGHWWGNGLFQACAATIVAGALAAVPAYLLARRVYGETVGVIASALYVVAPNVVLFGGTTCMDGVFALFPVVVAWLFFEGIAEPNSASTGADTGASAVTDPGEHDRDGRGAGNTDSPVRGGGWMRPVVLGVLMGIALSVATFFTFATVCVCVVVAAYNLFAIAMGWRLFMRALLVNSLAGATLCVIYGVAYWRGWFDIIDCAKAAIDENARVMGTGREDLATWLDVSTANLAAFLVGVGAAAVALWGRRFARGAWDGVRGRGADVLALAVTLAIPAIAFAGLFHFEVERIWIFLTPLVLAVAARSVVGDAGRVRWGTLGTAMVLLFAQTYLTELLLFTWW